jgi:hypothetical protein
MVLAKKRTTLRYLSPCATHLCQLADTFIISKIKDAWTKGGKPRNLNSSNKILGKISLEVMANDKLTNPEKKFFLHLAADSIEDVNRRVDIDNMSCAIKSIIRCGLALGADGTWSVNKLFPQLQQIVAKHQQYFEGLEVPQLHMTN